MAPSRERTKNKITGDANPVNLTPAKICESRSALWASCDFGGCSLRPSRMKRERDG
jgi:hypothetical protein